jgi:hypothetical protein
MVEPPRPFRLRHPGDVDAGSRSSRQPTCPRPRKHPRPRQTRPWTIRADEISRILREQIQDYGKKVTVAETGTVLSQGDGIARVYGLEGVLSGELVEFSNGVRASC